MKFKGIIAIFLTLIFVFTYSCRINKAILKEDNPCFYINDKEYMIECYKWRDAYPKEYNRFYDAAKDELPDSVVNNLPNKVIFNKN